ncbi:hypothetical protein MJD09_08625 [bacterium]|nr:hypothetical protein [bacterium]
MKDHLPTLKEYGLATDRDGYVAKSTDGTFIEVFEWASSEAKDAAHEHPAIAMIWEKMASVSDFTTMAELPEAEMRFPNFDILTLTL